MVKELKIEFKNDSEAQEFLNDFKLFFNEKYKKYGCVSIYGLLTEMMLYDKKTIFDHWLKLYEYLELFEYYGWDKNILKTLKIEYEKQNSKPIVIFPKASKI